jgi:hypothetical protein
MNENTFKQYIYENICQCPEQCLPDNDNYEIKKQDNCKEITPFNIKKIEFYDDKIHEILKYFTSSKLLHKVGNKYYISTEVIRLKLTWENIKTLHDVSIQKLLWLFRKSIVDLLLKKILVKLKLDEKPNFKIYSVGSNNLSSDYDITLYGDTKDKGNFIITFEKEFKDIFYEDSSIVFDTNIYGKSFISFEKNDLYSEFKCNDKQIIYTLNKSSDNSQLVWALIKYFQDIRNSFGENIFNSMTQFLIKHVKIPHINIAFETRIYLNNKDQLVQYNNLLSENAENVFLKPYKEEILQGTSDYISLLNFYGNETYFTRGTFLDIVINKQMCQKKVQREEVQLEEVDYISSILENSGFFFLHNNKTKYFIRVFDTLTILLNSSDKYKIVEFITEYDKIKKILDDIRTTSEDNTISYDSKYCNWIDETSFNLLKCEKYTIFNILLNINYEILKIFSKHYKIVNEKDISPFYNYYVKKNTDILDIEIPKKSSTSTKAIDKKTKKESPKKDVPTIIVESENSLSSNDSSSNYSSPKKLRPSISKLTPSLIKKPTKAIDKTKKESPKKDVPTIIVESEDSLLSNDSSSNYSSPNYSSPKKLRPSISLL